jgi:hypothetical protein
MGCVSHLGILLGQPNLFFMRVLSSNEKVSGVICGSTSGESRKKIYKNATEVLMVVV